MPEESKNLQTCIIYVSDIFLLSIFESRLDFANFVTSVTAVTGACVDSFIVTSPTGGATTTICGTNTNQHSKLVSLCSNVCQH